MLSVDCHNLQKSFGEGDNVVHALRGVNLGFPMGALSLLVGPSGCGKTTLISVIAGLLQPDHGRCCVLGVRLDLMKTEDVAKWRRRNVGFVFQQYNLVPGFSARENIAMPLLLRGIDRKEAIRRANERLEQVGISQLSDSYVEKLSGGQQQRVAIARALAHSPRLLVCDEPTSALDSESGELVMNLLSRIAQNPNRAVVVVTHDNRIFRYAQCIATMNDGIVTHRSSQGGEKTSTKPLLSIKSRDSDREQAA
ncbi:MAG: ABC transporter ATP-binding protein [Casimicrobium sp.]